MLEVTFDQLPGRWQNRRAFDWSGGTNYTAMQCKARPLLSFSAGHKRHAWLPASCACVTWDAVCRKTLPQ